MRRINKKIILDVLLIALLIASIVASITSCVPGPEISKDQAITLLVSEIIQPAAEYKGISAFMLSEPLQDGDVVTSESGEDYPIDDSTWFIFIDDEPMAFFAHGCRYVFINGETGSYDIVNESWPPEINNLSMWDTENLDRGHVIELYSVLDSAVPIVGSLSAGSPSQAPAGDYGDAPDGQDAYYGVPGRYPTLFNTANSQLGRPGGHTLNIGEETLGMSVSAEVDANDPADPDGVPNLVDADSDERISVIVEGTQAKLAFTVTVASNAPDVTRYANALIDFDQSGNWSAGTYGTEWVLVNMEVDVDPGSSETVITPWFSWGNQSVLPSPVWMRLLLAREKVDETLFANMGGWDGSGRFEYGEVEDYFVFLTDMPLQPQPQPQPQPPAGWPPLPGEPPGGYWVLLVGEAQLPGSTNGTCGYDIKYYSIIINGGDHQGDTIAKAGADTMAKLASAQNYTSIANLGPGNATVARNNTLSAINQTFNQLAGNVKCGDHVLIYITGHGYNSTGLLGPYIALKNATGTTREILRPKDPAVDDGKDNTLADFLKKIPCCPNEDCDTTGKCCNITVIIECCYAGSFNVTGVTGECRTVIGTSTNTNAYGYASGGHYTRGFDNDSRNATSDKNGDGFVSPMEAHVTAVDEVDAANQRRGPNAPQQTPWISLGSNCTCRCPSCANCTQSIDAEKSVLDWYGEVGIWVDEIQVQQGQLVTFRLEIENDGKGPDLAGLQMIDILPSCLEYSPESVTISYDGEQWPREPDEISPGEMGTELVWNLEEIETFAPGDSIAIEYDAIASYPGPNINELLASAHCIYDPTNIVDDTDSATVWVQEDLLGGYLEVSNVESFWSDPYTCESFFDVYFEVQDLTGGDYPVTYVGLYINGLLYDFWDTADIIVERDVPEIPADCGETIDVELVGMNLVGGEPITVDTASFTTPSPPPPVAEEVLYVGFNATAECTFLEEACLGCDVTISFWAEDISSGDIYPVTDVVLRLDGVPWFESGPISTGYFEDIVEREADCGQTIEIEIVAMNLIGLEAIAVDSLTTPSHP